MFPQNHFEITNFHHREQPTAFPDDQDIPFDVNSLAHSTMESDFEFPADGTPIAFYYINNNLENFEKDHPGDCLNTSSGANTSRDTSAERKTAPPPSLPSPTKRELHAERDDTAKKYKRIEDILDDKSRVDPLAAQEIRALLGICGPKPCSTSSFKLKRMPFERRRIPEQLPPAAEEAAPGQRGKAETPDESEGLSTNEHVLEDIARSMEGLKINDK